MNPSSDSARRNAGYAVIALTMASVAIHVIVSLSRGETAGLFEQISLGLIFSAVMMAAMRAAPSNGAVWALVGGTFCGAWGDALDVLVLQRTGYSYPEIEGGALSVSPASLDWLTAMTINLGWWVWLGYFLLPIHLVLLFPTGRNATRTGRLVMWVATTAIMVTALVGFFKLGPWVQTPYDEIFMDGALRATSHMNLVLLLLVPPSVVSLIMRFRRSSGVERLQFRWLTWAVALQAVALLSGFALYPLGLEESATQINDLIATVALAGIPIAIGIAITKYRLYDIDLVISRSLEFVILVGFITVVYAALVVGVGLLVGGSSLGWSIGATALVAVVFEPVRERVQRQVNRLVYGQRATPYEVLADLTGRLADTEREEGLLGRMASRLVEGIGADRAVVWVSGNAGFSPVACEPRSSTLSGTPDLTDIPGTVVPIDHDGERLGALSVETRRGDALAPAELRLVEDLAGAAGLLMRRLRLDAELERKAYDLAESRRRLIDAQVDERRRLERELNERVQQQVVALKGELTLAEEQARIEDAPQLVALIAQVASETDDAIDQIWALANGIYPPLLEADGLTGAISALGELAPVEVRVNADVSHRSTLPIEGAVYFCISEALTNAVKHGRPPISIRVSDESGELVFTVADTGPGFDPHTVRRGSGLDNMADRLDALEGGVTISSAPGTSTTLTGHVPLTPVEAVL